MLFVAGVPDYAWDCILCRGYLSASLFERSEAGKIGQREHQIRPGEFQPAAQNPSSGTQDFCLIVEEDIRTVRDEVIAKGWPLLTDVVDRVGARGKMKSIYMYDPDGNLVELAQYV